jgi:hypothetical protein
MAIIELRKPFVFDLGWQTIALMAALVWYLARREQSVYLIDFTTFEPPDDWRFTHAQILEMMKVQETYSPESIEFMDRMLKQSGTGPATSWPPGMSRALQGLKADRSTEAAREESKVSSWLPRTY